MYYALTFLASFWITFLVEVYKASEQGTVAPESLVVIGLHSLVVGVIGIVVYAIIDICAEE